MYVSFLIFLFTPTSLLISSTNRFVYFIFNVINFSLFLYVKFYISISALFFPFFFYFFFFLFVSFKFYFVLIRLFTFCYPLFFLWYTILWLQYFQRLICLNMHSFFSYSICIFRKDSLLTLAKMRCIVSKIGSRSSVKANTFLLALVFFFLLLCFSLFLYLLSSQSSSNLLFSYDYQTFV